MKKYEIYIIEIILFISIIMFNIVYKSAMLQNITILLLAIYSIARFGYMKDSNYLKSTIVKTVISSILVYMITIYLLGLLLGFNKTPFNLNINYFVKVVLLEAIIIISEEIMRYTIARNSQHKKIPLLIYTIILSILNIIIEINGYNLNDSEYIFIFITTVVIPTISIQLVCSYLTYKVSYVPSLIISLTMSLYQYILPIIPNLGNYLYAVTNIALPYIIFYSSSKIISYKEKVDVYKRTFIRRLLYIPVFILLIIIVLLASGLLGHTLIAIGSDSMYPSYERGDAVIYVKASIDDIKTGEIIAFKKNGKVITHRIININKEKKSINTKGDNNKTPDSWEVKESELLGVVKYRIKYIGYPTIWFNDIYNGKEKD